MTKQSELLTFTFVAESAGSAIAQATAAAGDKAVQVVGCASVAQELLSAGLVDELHVDVMPVLVGFGTSVLQGRGHPARPTREDRRA
jgi:dihydrofolate reductase